MALRSHPSSLGEEESPLEQVRHRLSSGRKAEEAIVSIGNAFAKGADGRARAEQPFGQYLLHQLVLRQAKGDVSLGVMQRITRILKAGDEARPVGPRRWEGGSLSPSAER